jgi:leucyl-tRNA synthetase
MIQGVSEKIQEMVFQNIGHIGDNIPTEHFGKSSILKKNHKGEIELYYLQANAKSIYYSWDFIKYLRKNFESVNDYKFIEKNIDITLVQNRTSIDSDGELDINKFIKSNQDLCNSIFVCEGGYWENGIFYAIGHGSDKFITKPEIEKMSKSKWNVVNPDDMIEKYGADTLRMYEMFLGPVEMSKPWNTNGITGVHNFLKKFWKLFFPEGKIPLSSGEGLGLPAEALAKAGVRPSEAPTKEELKTLHRTIKKVQEDIERFSFNTAVSTFMICVNELTEMKCHKKEILEPLVILLSPFAPHIAEELWKRLGHTESVTRAQFPEYRQEYLADDSFDYPVSVNGKTRFWLNIALSLSKEEVEKEVLGSEEIKKWLTGNPPKKVIVVPGKIVNVVV